MVTKKLSAKKIKKIKKDLIESAAQAAEQIDEDELEQFAKDHKSLVLILIFNNMELSNNFPEFNDYPPRTHHTILEHINNGKTLYTSYYEEADEHFKSDNINNLIDDIIAFMKDDVVVNKLNGYKIKIIDKKIITKLNQKNNGLIIKGD